MSVRTERATRSRFYDRVWLLAIALIPWLVQPGRIQPDTKVDLTIAPWAYLGRSLDAWNGHNGLGELQNQAYGYLFPMGPVFGVGHSLGLPTWVVQRIWWTLLIVVAFTGVRALIRRWEIAGPTASLVGATAYALSPRVLTLLSDHSVEAWPGAVAPWLLLAAGGFCDPRIRGRALLAPVARLGLLVAALGGVNATASAVAVVPALILLAVHPVGRRRILLLLLAAGLGGLWWLLPLFVLAGYAYPFLDYIETASITTAVTSVPNTLRGANNWIAYILDAEGHPSWQGGWIVAQSLTAIVLTSLVAALGVVGVLRLRGVVRRFALVSVVLGTLVMVVGHPGFAGAPFADVVRGLLDGPLVVFRNVHKIDLLIRLPLALGLAGLVGSSAHLRGRDLFERRIRAGAVAGVTLLALVPLWQGRVGSDASYSAVPASWQRAAKTVDRLSGDEGSTLLLPSSRTASYTWGRSTDEPLSAMANSPVVVRASAPLGHPVATRMLDAVDALAASGESQPALAESLARMGIRTVVVRRDLAGNAGAGSWENVEKTLAASPGLAEVAGERDKHRSIWRVAPTPVERTAARVVMSGGSEALPAALATGAITGDIATVLSADTREPAGLVTDSGGWRVYHNGAPAQLAYGPTLPASDPSPGVAGSKDLPPPVPAQARPHRQLIGLRALAASSSAADPFAKAPVSVAHSQYAAIDGDPRTTWLTGDHETTATYDLELAAPFDGGRMRVGVATGHGLTVPAQITVNGQSRHPSAQHADFSIARGTTTIRVSLRAPDGAAKPVMGLNEVSLDGVAIGSIVVVPDGVDLRTDALLLGADVTAATVPSRAGEEEVLRRRVRIEAGGRVPLSVWVRAAEAGGSGCGAAGSVTLGASKLPLRFAAGATGTLRRAVPCFSERVDVPPGGLDIRVDPAEGAQVEHLLLGSPPRGEQQPLFVTTHGANPGWTARGRTSLTVDGWRQAYAPGEGEGAGAGAVREMFAPTAWHRAGLLVGLLCVLLLAAVAFITRRVDATSSFDGVEDEPETHRAGPVRSTLLGAVVGGLAAGPVGVLVGLGAAASPRRLRPLVAALAMTLAGLALAFGGVVDQRSWGAAAGQVLGTLTLTVIATEVPFRRPGQSSVSTPTVSSPAVR